MAQQLKADWMDPEDQVWLGRWARQWATDPANRFMDPAKPNELDAQLLNLFQSIEQCRDDIDTKLDGLHEAWKHSGLPTKTLYRVKFHYLFRGVGSEIVRRASRLKTDSAEQTILNWNRLQEVYNGDDGSARPADAWIGPVTASPRISDPSSVGEPNADAKPVKKGYYVKGRGYNFPDGSRAEGPLVDLVMWIGDKWRDQRERKERARAASSTPADRQDTSLDESVITDA